MSSKVGLEGLFGSYLISTWEALGAGTGGIKSRKDSMFPLTITRAGQRRQEKDKSQVWLKLLVASTDLDVMMQHRNPLNIGAENVSTNGGSKQVYVY